eukprot:5825909-Amphidinium_carterae.1
MAGLWLHNNHFWCGRGRIETCTQYTLPMAPAFQAGVRPFHAGWNEQQSALASTLRPHQQTDWHKMLGRRACPPLKQGAMTALFWIINAKLQMLGARSVSSSRWRLPIRQGGHQDGPCPPSHFRRSSNTHAFAQARRGHTCLRGGTGQQNGSSASTDRPTTPGNLLHLRASGPHTDTGGTATRVAEQVDLAADNRLDDLRGLQF